MPTKLHACLDTNIPFRFITQGQPGCEPEHLDCLRSFVEEGNVTLLVPEVVLLELEKLFRDLDDDLSILIAKTEKSLTESLKSIWNEASDLLPFLKLQLGVWKRTKLDEAKVRHDQIRGLMTSDRAVSLPFDHDVHYRAKRRYFAGRFANKEGRPEADLCILESVIKYFEGRGEGDQLLFCTENRKDFGLELEKGQIAFHPLMREGLPHCELVTSLASLASFLKAHKPVEEPAPEEVEKALERDKQEKVEEQIEKEQIRRFTQASVALYMANEAQAREALLGTVPVKLAEGWAKDTWGLAGLDRKRLGSFASEGPLSVAARFMADERLKIDEGLAAINAFQNETRIKMASFSSESPLAEAARQMASERLGIQASLGQSATGFDLASRLKTANIAFENPFAEAASRIDAQSLKMKANLDSITTAFDGISRIKTAKIDLSRIERITGPLNQIGTASISTNDVSPANDERIEGSENIPTPLNSESDGEAEQNPKA